MRPRFLNSPTGFQTLKLTFKFLICSLIRGLDQVFVSKHMIKPFKHSAELFKHFNEHLKPQKKKSLAICLCYSTTHAVESTMVVFPIYPEAYCQTLKQTLSKKIAKNISVHTETNEQPACYLIAQRWKTWFAVAVTPKFFLVSWNNKVIFGLK